MKRILLLACLSWMILFHCSDKVETEISSNVLTVYPNPMIAIGRIHVNNNSQTFTLKIFDPTGEVILEQTQTSEPQTFEIDVRDRPTGKYHVVCTIGNIVYTESLLKI